VTMSIIRYKLYNGAGRYKIKNPAFNGKGSFVQGLALTVAEDMSAHHDVTCFDGGDGSITVVASGGTAPYIYSLDPSFTTYNTTGVFDGLSITGPVEEGTDEYGGIVVCHKKVYAKDANGRIGYTNVRLKSPVYIEWATVPENIVVHCDEGKDYATVIPGRDFIPPTINTTANAAEDYYSHTTYSIDNHYGVGVHEITFWVANDCGEAPDVYFLTITVLPND